jgi:hypothetical protein
MPDATAKVDRFTDQGQATTETTRWLRTDFTRFDDNSKDYFISEIEQTATGEAIIAIVESDTGEVFA